jgi:hypothetical protein
MPKKTFTPEQIVGKLRQIEGLVSQGKTVPVASREAGIVDETFYRSGRNMGGCNWSKPGSSRSCRKRTPSCGAR